MQPTNGKPDRSELGEEERAIIRRLLRRAAVKPTKEIVERLIDAVQALMTLFRQADSQRTRRERHDALRKLLRMAEEEDPPVAVVRKCIAELSTVDIAEAEGRAHEHELWSRVFPGKSLKSGFDFVVWSRTAPVAELLEAVRTFFADGGQPVRGRARPGGKRSKSRLEPVILSYARGAAAPSRVKAESPTSSATGQPLPPGSGRPRADAEDDLVMHLAWRWHRITGLEPQPGRGNQSPFGALVHHVFSWLDIDTAEQSLRRYWDEVQDTEITPIEGGQVFR